jgi:hypothetical protein
VQAFLESTMKMNIVTLMVTLKMATVTTAAMKVSTMETMYQPLSMEGATQKMILMRKIWLF